MALSAKQRQKKIERKNKRRKQIRKPFSVSLQLGTKAANYANLPVHECLIPSGIFDTGIGTVIVSRRTLDGNIAIAGFVVDVYCLGVKNALFNIASELEYERTIKPRLIEGHQGQHFDRTHVACTKKLIEGAVRFADELGFSPHPDYQNAKRILDNVDGAACPIKYAYGQDGKPFYVQGPNESPYQSKKIVENLHMKCGEGGYHYVVFVGGDMLDKDTPQVD